MAGGGQGPQLRQRLQERETFYEAQRRHRRSGWRFSLLSVMAVGLLGLPLSVVVSPFVTAVGSMGLDVINLVVPMPDPLGDIVDRIAEPRPDDAESVDGQPLRDEPVPVSPAEVATIAVALVVPGMVLMGVTWLGVRRLFLRSGAGAVVLAAGARPPRPGDLEERQLVNLVEEMALAAGVPPPRVMLLDSDMVNAAVVGRSIDDATLVVPRRMLDDLGRAPTGALVADLLAVVVNGDLRMALVIASVFQTFDLVGAALTAPFSRRTRQVLWRLFRLSLRRRPRLAADGVTGSGPGTATDAEVHFVASELAVVARMGGDDGDDQPKGGCLTTGLQFPFLVASIAFTLTRLIVGGFFVAPIMAALWRRRRLLADATAVELTRDPDSLMQAFDYLEEHATTVAAGPWTHLFVVGPEVAQERVMRRFEQRRDQIWTDDRQAGESALGAFRRRSREALKASAEFQRDVAPPPSQSSETADDGSGELAGFLPKLGKRRERLAAMGARLDAGPGRPSPPSWSPLVLAAGWVFGLTLCAVLLVLFLMLFGLLLALIYLAVIFELALLGPPVVLVHVLLR
jgi:Zn-dependent protease with chaperone function